MPVNKNAQLRYQILDSCFKDFTRKYEIDDLLDKVNDALYDMYGTEVSLRQIREDIKFMRDRVTYDAPIKAYPFDGKRCYYRYEDRDFSIFKTELSEKDINTLRSTIDMLGRYRGIPNNAWLEEVISNLEYRFGIKANSENVVSFEHNEQLKGIEFLGELIQCAVEHQPIRILYISYYGVEHNTIVHPYHVKQFNNRWFLFGLEQTDKGTRLANKALDRIVKFSRTNVSFIPNEEIDFQEYFKDIVGVTVPKEHPEPEKVVIRFDEQRYPYVISKPLHSSQEILDEADRTIQIKVRPNKELEALIFSYGPQAEVLEPAWLREQIQEKILETYKKYNPMQIGCTE